MNIFCAQQRKLYSEFRVQCRGKTVQDAKDE